MGQNTEERILEVFYENPSRAFTVRKIEKMTNLPRSTVHKYLTQLKKQRLITKENISSENLLFKIKKTNFFIEKILESGIVYEIIEKMNPSCIILFGSIRKGESNKESDIDLFIESPIKKEVSLLKYEKKLKHPIQLLTETDMNNIHSDLYNNIVNGIKLYGSFKIK